MTAAERAARVITEAAKPDRWRNFSPQAAVAALMAHPDLLVDLAIEAGGHCKRTVGYVGKATDD